MLLGPPLGHTRFHLVQSLVPHTPRPHDSHALSGLALSAAKKIEIMGGRLLLLLLLIAAQQQHLASAAFAKKSAKPKGAKKAAKSSAPRGFGAPTAVPSTKLPSLGDANLDAAIGARCDALKKSRNNGQAWLELGSLLCKAKEYSEAEKVFRAGAAAVPDNEFLSAAALTLGGDSANYCSKGFASDVPPAPTAVDDSNFEGYEAPSSEMLTYDQADRAVDWKESQSSLSGRGAVFRSKTPLLDPKECAWVIEQVEAQAAVSGWTKDRHVQAPTTDIPVSAVPAIRDWFDEQLTTTLFPMLAARYPDAIADPTELRVLDAFVVRYDAREQASLPTHQDENTFSFTIALNDRSEYEGGGTCFTRLKPVGVQGEFEETLLNADAGGVVAFPGKLRHGGNVVTSGRRVRSLAWPLIEHGHAYARAFPRLLFSEREEAEESQPNLHPHPATHLPVLRSTSSHSSSMRSRIVTR